jgi:indolepyruvate ferredoxin oxidoreductase alpha subunit
VRVEWTSNEKVAIEMAFGASLGGMRALLCVKSVGLNIALDPLMTFVLSGCNAGLVLLVGDDPGGWGSQNEQDSRALALAAEIPLLEPTTIADARLSVRWAFDVSEKLHLPVMVRFTRALALAREVLPALPGIRPEPPSPFRREYMRWVVLPANVVSSHRRLLERLDAVRARFEGSPFNAAAGSGTQGIISVGFTWQKLLDLLHGDLPVEARVLRLGTVHPLPTGTLVTFLRTVESVLVLEEGAPLVERAVRAAAQREGLGVFIYGRDTNHVMRTGELFGLHIADALRALLPLPVQPAGAEIRRAMPSQDPFCEGCSYLEVFRALTEAMDRHGGRDDYIVVGDPGCMVRAQSPPLKLLDVKDSLGSSIAIATGIALSQHRSLEVREQGSTFESVEDGPGRRVIALCGDSGLLHSGLPGLMDAVRVGARMLVMILDNGTTALSGGQPHPASQVDARGDPSGAVDLEALVRATGAHTVQVIDLDRGEDIRSAIEEGLTAPQLVALIARGQCVRWSTPAQTEMRQGSHQ